MSQPWQGIGDKSGLRVSKMTLENDFAGRDPGRSSSHPQSSRATFRDLFCETYQCLAEEFRDTVFWRCLYPGAIPLARLIWHLNKGYFRPDVELIERVGNLTKPAEIRLELNR